MLKISSNANSSTVAQLKQLQDELLAAKMAISAEDGMEPKITEALIQLHRFMLANIEVDTSRTKNSLFVNTWRDGRRVNGMVGTNVKYSPWVRDSGHNVHFIEHARRVEVPLVLANLGRKFTLAVKEAFSG